MGKKTKKKTPKKAPNGHLQRGLLHIFLLHPIMNSKENIPLDMASL